MTVGNSSGVAAEVTPSGDVTMTNAGVTAIGAGKVTGAMLKSGKGYFSIIAQTNGTTPVNVFGAGGAPSALTVVDAIVFAKDTTGGNIIMKQAANTVFTAAKGTTTGLATTAGTVSNGTYAAADVCTVESSSAGNAIVLITFTVA
jgi:hypothetical protein